MKHHKEKYAFISAQIEGRNYTVIYEDWKIILSISADERVKLFKEYYSKNPLTLEYGKSLISAPKFTIISKET